MDLRSKHNVSPLIGVYNDRFNKLLLSLDEGIIDAGKKTDRQKLIESSEQNDSRRLLLDVEELAIKKKEVAANAEHAFLQQVEATFHEALLPRLEMEFKDTAMIMDRVLRIDQSLGKLLDVLYTEACSISRLIACFENLPWLEQALLKFVHQPKYRRLDSSGHPIFLKTLRSALSFVGIESLRTLLPILVAKHINPEHSEYTPDLKKHIWLYTLGTGNIAKALSESHGIKPSFAFNLGLFSNIGRIAVVSIYLRCFDSTLRNEIIKARKKNNLNRAKALGTLLPSNAYIVSLWERYANKITANVIGELNCRWLMIAIGFEDFAKIREKNIKHIEQLNLHPFAKLLFTSQGFMQYKILQKDKLIGKQDASLYLRNFGIDQNDVTILKNTNLTGIDVNIAGVVDETRATE